MHTLLSDLMVVIDLAFFITVMVVLARIQIRRETKKMKEPGGNKPTFWW